MASETQYEARADRRIASMLAICFFLVYLPFSSGHFDSTDEITVFGTVESIWERGELALSHGGPHAFRGADGRRYSHFAIGQAVLKLPFYGIAKIIRQGLPDTWALALAGPVRLTEAGAIGAGTLEVVTVKLYGPVMSAVLIALFYLYERRLGVTPRNAFLASVLLGLTTYVATMSGYVLRHTTETVVILGVLCSIDAYRRSGRLSALGLGSTLTSMLLLVSVPAAIAGPPLGAYLLWVLRVRALSDGGLQRAGAVCAIVALPVLVALGTHLAMNYAVWGMWLDNPMLAQRDHFTTPFYVGAFGLLLSPGGSIFAYSPLLLLSPWTLHHFWQTHRAECILVLGISAIFLLIHSVFWSWTGLWSAPGPRYLFVVTPLLLLSLGPWFDGGIGHRDRLLIAALAGVGALVQISLMSASWTYVMHVMNYKRWAPKMEFMFLPDQSPILASARTVAAGTCDPWLCRLYEGWPDFDARPLAVVAVLIVWVFGFAISLWSLHRAYRAHPLPRFPEE
ncbi:MAG: hypothetical protein E2P02_25715 [Acidobacteria bacterium]|nr:MAG: hypothetical protein E2P02_25715 [Acidobacteriota bacterium]